MTARKERDGEPYRPPSRPRESLRPPGQCSTCGEPIRQAYSDQPLCIACHRRAKRTIHIPRSVRLAIYERDAWTCGICLEPVADGLPPHDPWQATLDHVVPRSAGGSDEADNLRLAHRWCNAVRSNRAGLTLAELQ